MENREIALPDMTEQTKQEMLQAFESIQMPKSAYVLSEHVVNARFTPEMRYRQAVMELERRIDALEIAQCDVQIKEAQIAALTGDDDVTKAKRRKKEIHLRMMKRAALGAMREAQVLFSIWKSFPKKYTHEEMEAAAQEEMHSMVKSQAEADLIATGRVSQSNQIGLREIHVTPNQIVTEFNEKQHLLLNP